MPNTEQEPVGAAWGVDVINAMASEAEAPASRHERTTSYARELLRQLNLAQDRLEALLAEHDPVVSVSVTTAVPLDDLLRLKVVATSQKLFNAPVFLIEHVDPGVLGGIVLEGSNQRFDMSVATQLQAVRRNLAATSSEGSE